MEKISKKEISAALNSLGFGFVKLSDGTSFGNGKVYKNWEGKSLKGFKGGSIGPMTMTNAHLSHNENTLTSVIDRLTPIAESVSKGENFTEIRFRLSDTQYRDAILSYELVPTYTGSADLDPGYKTYWLIVNFKDGKY